MSNHRNRSRYASVVVLACVALLSVAACSSSEGDGGSGGAVNATTGTQEAAPRENADRSRSSLDEAGRKSTGSDSGTAISLQDRAIVRRGSLQLTSADVAKARDTVIDDVERLGGYVADEQSSTDDDGDLANVQLALVVPTNDFDEAMTTSADAGEVVSREQSAEDVTEKVVDVNSRVDNAQASLRRIRLLLGRAEKLGDVIRLESVLGQREADLESLQARQKSLRQRTSTATIDVSIRPVDVDEQPPKKDEEEAGFLAGLGAGWSGLQTAWTAFATVAGALLPFVVALGIPLAIVALLVRRMLRRRTAMT